jgi:GT2 family glycosyltransferase
MSKSDVGQVQALIYPPDRSYYHAQTVMGVNRFEKPTDFLELSYACTAFTMLKKSIIEEIGEMDTNFMKWCFDVDYSWRIKERGYKVLLDPRVEAYHLFGETINRNPRVKREAERHDYEYFYQKWIASNRAKKDWYRPSFFNGWWR